MKLWFIAMLLAICLLLPGCGKRIEETPAVPHNPIPEALTTVEALPENWSYAEQQDWMVECGKMQSPIAIDTGSLTTMENGGSLMLYYLDSLSYIEDNGHTIEAGVQGAAMINRRIFTPEQVHFHAHSEHTVDGQYYPIEAHFVHWGQGGRLSVVAVFFTEGVENEAFASVLDTVKGFGKGKTATTQPPKIDINQLLPADKGYYHYLGSLTTPPLTENVEWYVIAQPIEVSAAQIKQFQSYYDNNYRDLQELNSREVLYYHP